MDLVEKLEKFRVKLMPSLICGIRWLGSTPCRHFFLPAF